MSRGHSADSPVAYTGRGAFLVSAATSEGLARPVRDAGTCLAAFGLRGFLGMKHSGKTFTLTKRDLTALSSCASDDPTRGYICKLLFEPAKAQVTATDGRLIMMVTAGSTSFSVGDEDTFCMDVRYLKPLLKKASDKCTVQAVVGKILVSVNGGAPLTFVRTAVDFPPTGTILAGLKPVSGERWEDIAFAPAYLEKALLMAKACNATRLRWTRNEGTTARPGMAPLLVECDRRDVRWRCVIMPMRLAKHERHEHP